jgi:hypothetical protein
MLYFSDMDCDNRSFGWWPKLAIIMTPPNKGVAANRRYDGQLGGFMKFDCQDCIGKSLSAAVAELGRYAD